MHNLQFRTDHVWSAIRIACAARVRSSLLAASAFAFAMSNASTAVSRTEPEVGQAPAVSPQAKVRVLRTLLRTPDERIDLARGKLIIDRMIDPQIDTSATLRQVDDLAGSIGARFPANAASQTKLELLLDSLSHPGPWNDDRAFEYDLDDPFGRNVRNKLLATYLASHKGNCISMPVLLVILGQHLGLNMTLAIAPEHVLVKFRDDQGQWIDIEATSFGVKRDASYERELDISQKAMVSGTYLRPLSKREALAVMMGTLMEFYARQGEQNPRIAVANLALEAYPNDVHAMLQIGNAYFRLMQQRYMTKYASLAEIPPAQQQDFEDLRRNNELWFHRAEELGWAMPTGAQDAAYLQTIQRTKATRGER